jgi:hypothetical protein
VSVSVSVCVCERERDQTSCCWCRESKGYRVTPCYLAAIQQSTHYTHSHPLQTLKQNPINRPRRGMNLERRRRRRRKNGEGWVDGEPEPRGQCGHDVLSTHSPLWQPPHSAAVTKGKRERLCLRDPNSESINEERERERERKGEET